jgi:hypothetical protein
VCLDETAPWNTRYWLFEAEPKLPDPERAVGLQHTLIRKDEREERLDCTIVPGYGELGVVLSSFVKPLVDLQMKQVDG